MGRKSNKKVPPKEWESIGNEHSFIRFYRSQFNSPAYRALSFEARELYRILKAEYTGVYSDARVGVNTVICPYTTIKSFGIRPNNIPLRIKELGMFGFIECDGGGFNKPSTYKFICKWGTITEESAEELKKQLADIKREQKRLADIKRQKKRPPPNNPL